MIIAHNPGSIRTAVYTVLRLLRRCLLSRFPRIYLAECESREFCSLSLGKRDSDRGGGNQVDESVEIHGISKDCKCLPSEKYSSAFDTRQICPYLFFLQYQEQIYNDVVSFLDIVSLSHATNYKIW